MAAPSRSVTEEEIAASLEEGLDAGVIEAQEHQMVRNVFRLDDRPVGSMMIPRNEIVWLDVAAPQEDVLRLIGAAEHSRYPVCRGGLNDVLGIVSAQSLLQQSLRGEPLSLTGQLQAAVFVPETLSGMELLEHFRATSVQLVFVVDEYGEVQGVITVRDVLEAITGEFTTPSDEDTWAVQRADGSWLFDGLIPVPELKDRLEREGAARGGPRPLQHAGRHGDAAARSPAADRRRGGVGGLALRGRRPRRQARRQGARHAAASQRSQAPGERRAQREKAGRVRARRSGRRSPGRRSGTAAGKRRGMRKRGSTKERHA